MLRSGITRRRIAGALFAAAIIVPLALLAATRIGHEGGTTSCGDTRLPVKTLADPAGRALRLGRVQATTIEALRHLPPRPGGRSSRGAPVERTVYRVGARLVAAKVIDEDSDIHLVIADPKSDETMIAELPAFSCTGGATRRARLLMEHARSAFLQACGDPGATEYAEYGRAAQATITGVGFFDFLHGQRGVAPNAIELHPVIGFAGRCPQP